VVDRLTSGHPRLDRILGGGFIAPSVVLLAGLPGTGKTVLAQQYAFANGTEQHPAVFLTTLTEPLGKVLHFAEGLSFFDVDRVGRSVVFEDLGLHLDTCGLDKALARITEIIERTPCSLLVIDSFRALRHSVADPGEFEGFVHELAGRLAATGTMAMWLGEYARDELERSPELAVADAAVLLATEEVGQRESRELRVVKLRGSGFHSGAHAYRIGGDGIDPFPRLSEVDRRWYPLDEERTSSGIQGLDELLAEGYWPGSSTLVAGPSGCGKTVMGLQFVFTGARLGEPGVYASLQENEVQLARMIDGLGWQADLPGVHLRCDSPNDIYIDQWFYQLFDTVEACGARRLVIDSLGDLAATCQDDKRFREFVYSLLSTCSRAGVSSIVTYETPELFEHTRLSERGVSHLSDNVILLQYLPQGSVLSRALTVLKTRASRHLPQVREYEITQGGISVGEPINPRGASG
jgi:circadian clock protein KaiC